METVFTNIYESNIWGANNIAHGYSGTSGQGSDVSYNADNYIPFLKKFIAEHNIESIVDLGCGDFRCGPLIYDDLDVTYNGYDIYEKVIEYNKMTHSAEKYTFRHLDFCNRRDEIISGDLCILKDVIQHWCLNDIYMFLDYMVMSKKYKHILICNCCYQRDDDTEIQTGGFRPLSSMHLPLSKYGFKPVYTYHTKEVSLLSL
jgi:hypothetical protein